MTAIAVGVNTKPGRDTSAYPMPCTAIIGQQVKRSEAQNTGLVAAPSWHFMGEIKYGKREFQLARPLTVRLQQNADLTWEACVSTLGIVAFGVTPQLAINGVHEEFAVIWDGLAFELDDNLTEDAMSLKASLRQLVKLK